MEILYFLLIGAGIGWLAGLLWKGGGFGLIGNIIVGVVGAFVGGYLAKTFDISIGSGLLGQIITAVGGSLVVLFVVSFIKK